MTRTTEELREIFDDAMGRGIHTNALVALSALHDRLVLLEDARESHGGYPRPAAVPEVELFVIAKDHTHFINWLHGCPHLRARARYVPHADRLRGAQGEYIMLRYADEREDFDTIMREVGQQALTLAHTFTATMGGD